MSNKLHGRKEGTAVELSPIPPELKSEVDKISAYVKDFIKKRFPNGLNDDMNPIISEIVLDALVDGMRWHELQTEETSLIIQP